MILSESKIVRLYGVSPEADANGDYQLKPFDSDDFNQEFDIGNINEELDNIRDYLYDNGCWYQIDDDSEFDDTGRVCIRHGDNDEIRISDVRDKIECDEDATFYIIVDAADRGHRNAEWVVAAPCGAVYSD